MLVSLRRFGVGVLFGGHLGHLSEPVGHLQLHGVYNLGTGESDVFLTVVEMITEELGTDVEPAFVENPIPESVYVHDICADDSKMGESTGWERRLLQILNIVGRVLSLRRVL